ncbi:MAG: UDP-N-acetylmuramoyl-L-alanyl-D-glutamate--2,6-diaminopimelate ligase [Acidimicrobiia bacterium]|nr:MAG: UDP-N-acetylmuramoyl-L-alanyl-D-glutamate--2,6-diaminopimelate ligase [Acidimicrobiia bacterium]
MSGMGVLLRQVAERVPGFISLAGGDVSVSDITHDSRQVRPGTLFVAIPGEQLDGHDFIGEAVERGASAVLVERVQQTSIPHILVEDTRLATAWAARAVFREPDSTLVVAAVTGTNGKTTVTHMLESILVASGVRVGIIGTLGARIDGSPVTIARTTPEATDLQRILATMRDSRVHTVLMEVSSHAIELHRSDAIVFAVVGFTNLSQDHLDFHGDMETYFDVKRRLFAPGVADTAVVNTDDPWGERLTLSSRIPSIAVSLASAADITADGLEGTAEGTSFTVHTPGGSGVVALPLVGVFNVSNALVAIGMAVELGVDLAAITEGLEGLDSIPGRMEVIPHDGPFTVVVDYAHTPDAIAVVLDSVRSAVPGRVIALVGAGGDRDRDKRSIMGATAARLSDLTVITTDNPRSEDPVAIADEVRRGAEVQPGATIEMVIDRREAIRYAVQVALPGDMVVVLGKGHEQGQDVGAEILPFDDRAEVRDALTAAGWTPS